MRVDITELGKTHTLVERDRYYAMAQAEEDLGIVTAERDALAVALAETRAASIVTITPYCFDATWWRCRLCLEAWREGKPVRHEDSCPLARPAPARGAELLAAASRLAELLDAWEHIVGDIVAEGDPGSHVGRLTVRDYRELFALGRALRPAGERDKDLPA